MEVGSLNELNERSSKKIVIDRIRRIIEKYPIEWRIFLELLQNSIDAIHRRENIKSGKISVEFDLENDRIKIIDNGRGFPKDVNLLLPDSSDKSNNGTLGYQGVGLKSVIYSSRKFSLEANCNGESWGVEINNGYDYIETYGEVMAPLKEKTPSKRLETGTTIEIKFPKSFVLKGLNEMILNAYDSSEINWETLIQENRFLKSKKDNPKEVLIYLLTYYLKTKTYFASTSKLIGSYNSLEKKENVKDIELDITIMPTKKELTDEIHDILRRSNDWMLKNKEVISFQIKNGFWNFRSEVEKFPQTIIPFSFSTPFEIPRGGIIDDASLKNKVYIKIFLPNLDASTEEEKFKSFYELINSNSQKTFEKNKIKFKKLFEKTLGIYLQIGRLDYNFRYGLHRFGYKILSANGIPTKHDLSPRTTNYSFYWNPFSLILNIDAKLNEGKTHLINSKLVNLAKEFVRCAYEATLNRFVKAFVKREVRASTIDVPIIVDADKIELENVTFKRIPTDESSLIGLFCQLIQVLNTPIEIYGLFGGKTYDGRFAYPETTVRSDNDLKSLEFKLKLQDLIIELDDPNNLKEFRELDLIIVWDKSFNEETYSDWRLIKKDEALPDQILSAGNPPDWIDYLLENKAENLYRSLIEVKEWVSKLENR
ncbi:MAG: ATP-binding protein [Promethearchaeota archaeon]